MERTTTAPGGDHPVGASDAPGGTTGPPPRRRRPTTVRDMVLSLAVIVAAVAAVLLLVPPSPPIEQPAVDRADALAAAQAAAPELGFAPAVPDLGAGWQISYARVETVLDPGVRQWRVGYLSPEGRRVDLEQAVDVDDEWFLRPDAGDEAAGEATGPDVPPGPPAWRPVVRGDGDVAYATQVPVTAATGPDEDGASGGTVATVVSTSAGWELAAEVARSAAPPQTARGG